MDQHEEDTAAEFSIGQAAGTLGVSIDTLRRWEKKGRLTCTRRGNRRFVPATEVRRLLQERPRARESVTPNRFEGVIVGIDRSDTIVRVEIASGGQRLTSIMSCQSADELGLAEGDAAVATIKAVHVAVAAA
jgi:molybdopterin-binding protein